MLLESLVFITCAQGDGCGTVTEAYYKSNAELQSVVKGAEDFGKRLVKGNEYIVYAATPIYAIATGQGATFKIGSHSVLLLNPYKESVGFVWTY